MKIVNTQRFQAPKVSTIGDFVGAALSAIGWYFFSDVGMNGSLWYNNGSKLVHDSELILAQSGIPFVFTSSGTMGDNGALSGITALPTTYSTAAYLYFPANAIVAGSAAGWYFTIMSSTTAGTVYNNMYTSGMPTIPEVPTPFVTTGPGAYTQTTGSEINGPTITVKGGIIGPNGSLRVQNDWSSTVNANAKTCNTKLDGTSIHGVGLTSVAVFHEFFSMKNRGVQNKQISTRSNTSIGGSSGTTTPVYTTIDTTVDTTLIRTFNSAVATDNIILEGFTISAFPGL